MARWIAGLDGCRGAWAAVLLDLDAPDHHEVILAPTVASLFERPDAPVMAAIDIPIGLPDRLDANGRAADASARRALVGQTSSVFAVPPRAAIYAADYEDAKRLARLHSTPPRALSIQTWQITGYIREVDTLLRTRAELADRLLEAHPEIAFRQLNGGRPLAHRKKQPEGLAERLALLRSAGLPVTLLDAPRPRGMPGADFVDALACLVVAREIALGRAISLPDPPGRDDHGLPVAIRAPALRSAD